MASSSTASSSSVDAFDSAFQELVEKLSFLQEAISFLDRWGSAILKPLDSALEELIEKMDVSSSSLSNSLKPFVYVFNRAIRFARGKLKGPAREIEPLCLVISELRYCNNLRKLLIYIDKCSNADKVVPKWRSSINDIETAFDEIARDLRVAPKKRKIAKKPRIAVELLRNSVKKFKHFTVDTVAALDHLSISCCSLDWHFLHPGELLNSVFGILNYIWLECLGDENHDQNQRQQLEAFGLGIIRPLRYFLNTALPDVGSVYPRDHMIINFFAHIVFVASRIANLSIHYWLEKVDDPAMAKRKITGILVLQPELDPLDSKFLNLTLKFLKALNRIHPGCVQDLLPPFLRYIIPDDTLYKDFQKKLEPLIIFVINESEEEPSSNENVMQGLVAEITAMLILVGLSSHDTQLHHFTSCVLRGRVYLLDVEFFLEQQLMNSSKISVENKVDELVELLTYLGIGSDQTQQKIENELEQTFMFFVDVSRDLASLYHSVVNERIEEGNMRFSILMLLLKIVIFKAKSYCTELLQSMNANASIMGSRKDQLETILEGMEVFEAFRTHQEEKMTNIKDVELIFTHIGASARGITSLYYSFIVHKIITEEMILSFSDLLDKMKIIKAELREICPGIPRPNFPKVVGLHFIDSLLENLSEKLKHSSDAIALVSHHIERIQLDLPFLRPFLKKADTEHPELKDLGSRITDVAYNVEYIIDSIEVGIGDHWRHLLWLHDLQDDIKLIKIQCTKISEEAKIFEEKIPDATNQSVAPISSNILPRFRLPETGQIVERLIKDEEAIVDRLTRGSSQRDVISIVGMPGIGKTTLANQVYNDPNVASYFHIRAWCSVSQVHARRELLLDVLSNICVLNDNVHEMTDEDLALQLYQRLKRNKYLIVMDDVWDNGAWNALEESLPDDGNGSRILMTSRLCDVALKAKPGSNPYKLRLLSVDESWKLLQKKVFHEGCPKELLEVGKEVAKSCKGLPLSIVAIAGLLKRTEKKQDTWKKVAESLSSQIIEDPQTQCMEIVELSYNHLSDNLKACFLYFGTFLEDKDIPVSKLIRLWIAEGFIWTTGPKSLEDLAEDHLIDLIGRSLVTISKQGSRRRVKACRIHDLMRDFCLSKAKDENFLQLINRHHEPYRSLSDFDIGGDHYDRYPSNPVKYGSHRMCFVLKRRHFIKSSPHGPCTRSLIFHATSDMYPRSPYDISFIPCHFRLLSVLDLETINMGNSFPTGMDLLAELRYLAVSGDIEFIPASIANLRKLETLIVKGLKGKVNLPDSVWSMAHLRHIHVSDHVDFNSQDDELESVLQLDNLVTFSLPLLSYGNRTEKILRRLPNLRKLGCIFLESWGDSRNHDKFPELDFLVQLESLKILYSGRILNPRILNLPRNLKKLTLSNLHLPWNHIAAVGSLENLEVLKLLSQAFVGKRWEMGEGEFLKLKYLKLDNLNIVHWNASKNHVPELEHLVLRNCKVLEAVPYDFMEILTLTKIEVQLCGQSTEDSVRNIMEEGIEGIEIIINGRVI